MPRATRGGQLTGNGGEDEVRVLDHRQEAAAVLAKHGFHRRLVGAVPDAINDHGVGQQGRGVPCCDDQMGEGRGK